MEHFCSTARNYPSKVRVTFGMITNGSFPAERLLPLLQKYGVKISISIDGHEESHNQVRYTTNDGGLRIGSWNTISRNVERLLAEGIRPYFLFTITRLNYRDLRAFADFAHSQSLGFRLSLVRQVSPPSEELVHEIADYLVGFYRQLAYTMPTTMRFERDAKFAEWNLAKKKHLACGTCRNCGDEAVCSNHETQIRCTASTLIAKCPRYFIKANLRPSGIPNAYSSFCIRNIRPRRCIVEDTASEMDHTCEFAHDEMLISDAFGFGVTSEEYVKILEASHFQRRSPGKQEDLRVYWM